MPGVGKGSREFLAQRQFQNRPPHERIAAGRWCHKSRAFASIVKYIQGRAAAFSCITIEQVFSGDFLQNIGELPGGVYRIGESVIQASYAKNWDDVRGITDKHDVIMFVIIQTEGVGGVNAPPLQFPGTIMPDHRKNCLNPVPDSLLFDGGHRVL